MIPTTPGGDQPAFSKTKSQQLWVLLLEKAYAKAYGDYQKIVGGQPYQAIKDLSGGPGRSFSHSSVKPQQIWTTLFEANKKQFLMSGGTQVRKEKARKIEGRQENVTNEGIVLGHAYSILDVVEINKQKILKLRNPWGVIQWEGDWSDKSSKWTPQMLKKLNYTRKQNDGTFWMPFNAYFEQYSCTTVNYLRPMFYYNSISQTNIKTVAVKTKKGSFTTGYFMVSQRDHRNEGLPVNTPYSLAHLVSFICIDGKVTKKVSDNKYLYQRQGSVEFQGLKANQEAFVMVGLQKSANITIGYYGDQKIDFQIENDCLPYMEGLAYLQQVSPDVQEQPGLLRSWLTSVGDIGFMCFKNISPKFYTLIVTLTTPKNIKILPPQGNVTKLKIEPGQRKSIKGKILDAQNSFSFGPMKFSWEE